MCYNMLVFNYESLCQFQKRPGAPIFWIVTIGTGVRVRFSGALMPSDHNLSQLECAEPSPGFS